MKSLRMKMAALLAAASFAFAGCGDALYVMTPEEEAGVVSYASHAVAKFNKRHQEGEIFVRQDVLDGIDGTEETESQESLPPEEDMPEEGQAPEEGSADAGDSQSVQESVATLGTALDLGAVQADYTGSSLCVTYEKSDVFAIDASEGKQLLALNVKLTNPYSQDLHIDILAMTPTFQATVNETETAMAQTTILPNDLSTYQGDLLAGESVETVLLFQISQEIQEISSVQLKVTMDGMTNMVNL